MILYNVTISIDQVVEIEWLKWMKEKHIQDVLNTGCFTSARLCRLTSHSQPDTTSYAVQYSCPNDKALAEYYEKHAPKLREEGLKKFADKMHAFRTELEVIEDFYAHQS